MLEYDRIDISEGIDVDKTSKSKECKICHYWHFKDINFKYELLLCNGCHGLMPKAVNLNDVAIVYIKGSAYRIRFWYISKDNVIDMINNATLIKKMGILKKNFYFFCFLFFIIYKMNSTTYYQRNKDVILNRAKEYYKNDKERLKRKSKR